MCTNVPVSLVSSGMVVYIILIVNSRHARGVCILLDTKFKGTVQSVSCDNEGCKILLNIKCDEAEYTIANVYCPTDQREL